MEQTLSELHPNPGWGAPEIHATDMVGKHCILELYDCDPSRLDDEAFIRTTITSAAKGAGATLLNLITHQFQPQGVTGLALLAESHISIHTWPESGYAAIDVFTCGPFDRCINWKVIHAYLNQTYGTGCAQHLE